VTEAADAVERFEPHRDRLFGVAYRMTGSVADAEDCVQESFLRWERTDRGAVRNDEAFLVRTTTRLAIDRQRQVARRRETYVGPWLPEPLLAPLSQLAPRSTDPADDAAVADSLSFAFLVMLDRLSASERAAFILHDVFGIPFDEVAITLERDRDACRQLASRARRKLRATEGDASASSVVRPVSGQRRERCPRRAPRRAHRRRRRAMPGPPRTAGGAHQRCRTEPSRGSTPGRRG